MNKILLRTISAPNLSVAINDVFRDEQDNYNAKLIYKILKNLGFIIDNVNESVAFKRGIDPKKSMSIGQDALVVQKFNKVGITIYDFKEVWGYMWEYDPNMDGDDKKLQKIFDKYPEIEQYNSIFLDGEMNNQEFQRINVNQEIFLQWIEAVDDYLSLTADFTEVRSIIYNGETKIKYTFKFDKNKKIGRLVYYDYFDSPMIEWFFEDFSVFFDMPGIFD